jgi:hypothetical protein
LSIWQYKNKDLEDIDISLNAVGFVYTIYSKTTNKYYIGRKLLTSTSRKPPKKDQTRRKKVVKESTWRSYYGSSVEMKALVTTYGKDDFIRTIIRFCKTKSEMAYYEAKLIFESDALIKEEYINRWITCRINSSNLKYLTLSSIL